MARLGFVLVLCLWSSVASADSVWTGGDLLATDPLDCGGAPAPADHIPYGAGSPTMAPVRAGKRITVVNLPKRLGIDYFDETRKGMVEAAAEIGSVDLATTGSRQASGADQAIAIAEAVKDGVDGILVSANDPEAVAPALKAALGKGIDVVGYDADADPQARQWFVNPAEANGIAKTLIDRLALEIGEGGAFGIVTSSVNAPNQARWIAEMAAYASKCHAGIRWLETVEAGEDNVLSFDRSVDLMSRYAGDLKGLVTLTSVATPAAAEAVTRAGLCGQVAVLGLATPSTMRSYVKAGCVKAVVLWNPIDLGYASVYVLRAVADGRLKPGDASVPAGRLGALSVLNGSEILLGQPFVFTVDNIDRFGF